MFACVGVCVLFGSIESIFLVEIEWELELLNAHHLCMCHFCLEMMKQNSYVQSINDSNDKAFNQSI